MPKKSEEIEFKFDFEDSPFTGETTKNVCTIHLKNLDSHTELINLLIHESIHAVLNIIESDTDADQDHWAQRQLESEWF